MKIFDFQALVFSSILELTIRYIAYTATNFLFTGVSERCSNLDIGQRLQSMTRQV